MSFLTHPRSAYAGTRVLAVEPMVALTDTFATAEECDRIIQLARERIAPAKVSLEEGGGLIPGRSGSNCWLRYSEHDLVREIGERVAGIVGIPLAHAEALQVIHYGPEQEYRPHYDAYDLATPKGQRACRLGGQRVVTGLIYLSEVESGGETAFPLLQVEVTPRKGQLLLFNNVVADLTKPDRRSLHGGKPVLRGEKWACNVWFHARPMRETQDFAWYFPASDATPARAASPPEALMLRTNRASRLFEKAAAKVADELAPQTPPVCFSHWDTYGGVHLDPAGLPPDTRIITLLDRRISNRLANKSQLAALIEAHGLEHLAPRSFATAAAAVFHDPDPDKLWFVKPVSSTGGRGMYCLLGRDLGNHGLPPHTIVQEAITGLKLYENRKFTSRVYLLIWNRELYLYENGFLLIHGAIHQSNSTDYAVQIDHAGYHRPDAAVRMVPLREYSSYETYFPPIRQLILDLRPVLESCRLASTTDRYLLLGIDLLFLANGQVQLVEINTVPNFIHSPAINTEVNVPFFVAVLRTLLGSGDPDLKRLPTQPPRPGAGNRKSPAAS
jgi:hypothetical protein